MSEKLKPGRAFELRSKDVPLGAFAVSALPYGAEVGIKLNAASLAVVFEGDGSMAGDLFGPVIALKLREQGYDVGILLNPCEESDMEGQLGHQTEAG